MNAGNFSFREESPGQPIQIADKDSGHQQHRPPTGSQGENMESSMVTEDPQRSYQASQYGSNPKYDYYSMLQNKPMTYQQDFQEHFKDNEH